MKIENVGYTIFHPITAFRVASMQEMVKRKRFQPPSGSTAEEFFNLKFSKAADLMGLNNNDGGVQLKDWSNSDQERLKNGQKPLSHPEHPNV